MPLRVEAKAKLLISNDNVANPLDIAFNSGDKIDINAADYDEATSKVLNVAALTTDEEVDLDNITGVSVLFMLTAADTMSVTLVPTGAVLADCTALPLLPNVPLLIGSDLVKVYVSNSDAMDSATIKIGAAGN